MLYSQFIFGLLCLILGAEGLVRGATNLANKLFIPPLFIGMTVIALGTSLPELFISLQATLNQTPELAFGNLVGSNITNILLILSVSILLHPFQSAWKRYRIDIFHMALSAIIFYFACLFTPLNTLTGICFLTLLCLIYAHAYKKNTLDIPQPSHTDSKNTSDVMISGFMITGSLGLMIGSDLTVTASTQIAQAWGVSETIIGLTLVAFSTSLPELATTISASFKKQNDMVLGNIIGSNILNLLLVFGLISLFIPMDVPSQIIDFDAPIMLAVTVALCAILFIMPTIYRLIGIVFLMAYAAYIYHQFIYGS